MTDQSLVNAYRIRADELAARCRDTAQILIAAVGADGPTSCDVAARRAVERILELEAERDRVAADAAAFQAEADDWRRMSARLRAALEAARDLSEIVRMPNAEHVADAHNDAVRKLREALR